jgi:hypothetical protein
MSKNPVLKLTAPIRHGRTQPPARWGGLTTLAPTLGAMTEMNTKYSDDQRAAIAGAMVDGGLKAREVVERDAAGLLELDGRRLDPFEITNASTLRDQARRDRRRRAGEERVWARRRAGARCNRESAAAHGQRRRQRAQGCRTPEGRHPGARTVPSGDQGAYGRLPRSPVATTRDQ